MSVPGPIHDVLPSADHQRPTRLTAVFVVCGPYRDGEKTLQLLAAQTAAGEMEVILATDVPANFEAAASHLEQFGAVQRIVGDVRHLPHLRAACAMRARAPYVAFCEDHSFPEASWAAELIAAFDSDPKVAAVSPVMVNPNPTHPVSRAQFSAYFARAAADQWAPGHHVVSGLPWHQTAYRADALRAVGDDLGHALEVEGFLQEQIVRNAPASIFVLTARTAVHHVNVSRLGPACHHGFVGGRLYAAERSRRLGWSLLRRAIHALSSPIVPFVRLRRDRHLLNATVRGPLDAVNLWLHAYIMALFHAAGEATGVLFREADLVARYSNFECRRSRFVRAADVVLLEA